MSKATIVKVIIGGLMIATVFFVGGIKVGNHFKGKNAQAGYQMGNRFGDRSDNRPMGIRRGGGFASGEIISSDDKSITIKLQDNGSKIIYLSETTPIMKSTTGTRSDLTTGTTVIVNGAPNQDNSIAAQSVQIKPAEIATVTKK